jgi:hypothetical protein
VKITIRFADGSSRNATVTAECVDNMMQRGGDQWVGLKTDDDVLYFAMRSVLHIEVLNG